jgi:very-short-patch-repair endonuclease
MTVSRPTLWQLQERAKWMRANPTDAEKQLWTMLRDRRLGTFEFKRQQIIYPYIVDCICLSQRLIIEADGSQHADSKYDERRDAFLAAEDFRVLRFWNIDVISNSAGVFDAVSHALTTPHPPTASRRAPPSPARGEGLNGATCG